MIDNFAWPFIAAVLSWFIAQLVKPFFGYLINKNWDWHSITSSGGFPSSHTAIVVGMASMVGFVDGMNSVTFAIAATVAFVVIYDAYNVRYHSGKNIARVNHLIRDLDKKNIINSDDGNYILSLKENLGHRFREVVAGGVVGFLVAYVLWIIVK